MYLASADARKLGFGYDFMKSRNTAWVISRFSIMFERPLQQNESIDIRTYPRGTDRLFYYRAFEITDTAGNEPANAESAWLIIDIDSRMPLKDTLKSSHAGNDFTKPPRLTAENSTAESMGFIDVNDTHIDVNGHVNNTHYIEWMLGGARTDAVLSMDINYKRECFNGDRLEIFRAEEGDRIMMTLKRLSDDKVVALSEIGL